MTTAWIIREWGADGSIDLRKPHWVELGVFKIGWKHTDDLIGRAIEGQVLADDRWIAMKQLLPEPVCQDDDRRRLRAVVWRPQQPAELRACSQQRKELLRYGGSDKLLWLLHSRQDWKPTVHCCHALERLRVL